MSTTGAPAALPGFSIVAFMAFPLTLFTSGFACLDDGVPVTENPVLLPVCIQPSSAIPPTDNPVTLHLPGGYHIDCLSAQLPDVLRAVKHAEA
ncbi:hypothetical protein SQV52_003290 [Salmonella enterica]|nr:hypothetical protein [Salmonella enterica]EEI2391210.1 hypothetical protein [Salmonella enterica subsp. enterica serovar Szentes]EHH3921984.1 hypothetical protein [Salmonella enterica subsp. enterica]EHS2977809.1 hypothetical protein [Salmonella enterica subsp. enterica serovar 16:l,v:- 2]EEU8349528.1 hypothetical protein [Salmonella enterica subsp. enterica serovar Szentes]